MNTLQQIGVEIEKQILKGCGAAIEWTFRSGEQFTISGEIAAVNRAVLFCIEHNLALLDGETIYDAELDETFAYMKAPTAA
jgi:hypothetical protein